MLVIRARCGQDRGPMDSLSAREVAILASVVLGIVLLQVVDDGKTGPVGASRGSTTTASTTSTTTGKPGKTTTTTSKAAAVKTAAQIRLLVLNAGAPNGSAASTLATL